MTFLLARASSTIVLSLAADDTIVFHDSNSCLVARTRTHQYTFCFRRQSCPQGQTSAFCTTKALAQEFCHEQNNRSNLLTIENDEEYRLINDVVSRYSNETLLNADGLPANRYSIRAQWMWVNGVRGERICRRDVGETRALGASIAIAGLYNSYHWDIDENTFAPIRDQYWCENRTECAGGKGGDAVVLNIVCRSNDSAHQVCLATRRPSEPAPFICKRPLRNDERGMTPQLNGENRGSLGF